MAQRNPKIGPYRLPSSQGDLNARHLSDAWAFFASAALLSGIIVQDFHLFWRLGSLDIFAIHTGTNLQTYSSSASERTSKLPQVRIGTADFSANSLMPIAILVL